MPVYTAKPTSGVSEIWESLGTFWADFEDKDLVEAFWNAMLLAAKYSQKDLYYKVMSRTLSTLPPIIISEHDYFTVYFSGINQNTTATSGYYLFDLPKYTYYISGLSQVEYSGSINQDVYTLLSSGVEYYFGPSTDYRIQFADIPSGLESRTYYIAYSKKINPVLIDVYGQTVGIDFSLWVDEYYTPFVNGAGNDLTEISNITDLMSYDDVRVLNLKYLIWGLYSHKKNAINVVEFNNALNIALACPFTWYSGAVSEFSSSSVTLDHGNQFQYRYLRYSGAVQETGYKAFTFDNLISGTMLSGLIPFADQQLSVYDYSNYSTLITGLVSNYKYHSTTVTVAPENTVKGTSNTNHEGVFFTAFMKSIFPRSLNNYFYLDNGIGGLSGLVPLSAVQYISPINKNVNINYKSQIPLTWYPSAYTDSYNVYYVEGTTSGFGGTPVFYKNTEDTTVNFYPTITGVLTHWVRWEVRPVSQEVESTISDIVMFSYTRIS